MKKRILSLAMALALCLTLLPAPARADELGPVDGTSTVETAGADAEAEAKAKAGAEAVAAVQAMIDALPEEITADDADIADALAAIEGEMAALSEDQRAALDVSRYEAALAALEGQADEAEQDADESENADADDTEQGTASDDNYTPSESGGGTAEVDKLPSPVQAMIDALPDALTEENAGDVSAMLGEIDAAMAALGDEERAALDLTQYQAVIAALAALAAAQGEIALYADESNKPKGDGTEARPYQITSTKELEWFRDTVNAGKTGICAELMNDLHFNDETGWTWTPIGKDAGKAYTGTFNGNGYKIKMDYAVAPDGMTAGWGLFGSIGNDGKVQDLEIYLSNFGWDGKAFSISKSGMLAAYNSGTIERCTATSNKIYVSRGVGLLVYQNDGTIQDCWTKLGTGIGEGNLIGGVAYTNNGKIKNCFFNGGFKGNYLNDHTITFEKGNSGSIANCYFISGRNYADNTGGVTGVEQADANSGKLTVKLNNDGYERGSKVDPWRIGSGSTNRYPSLKKTDRRVSYDSTTDKYEKGDPPHMHGNVEFTKVNALSEITASGNYYISGAIKLNSTWEVDKKILLCLDGQTITAASGVAPAIKIGRGGSLTLVDGSQTGSGKITGGATGVTLNGGAFTMQGGEIIGNTVGVDVKSGSLTLGGKAQITGNDKNILLAQGSKISFDSLDPSAKFGISVENQKDLSDPVAVTDMTGGQYFGQLVADGFKDNGVGFELYLSDDGKTVMLGKQSAHTHCICGGRNTNLGHTSHSDVTFQPWRETDKLPTSGNYYLTRNVTLTKNATLQNANVCLNGYTVTLSNVGRINPSGTTQLTDCSVDGKGKLESYAGKANGGVAISRGNKFSLYGGTLNGVKVEIGQTGGGTFNMYGGKITGNTQGTVVGQSKTGGNQSAITINMYGGEISGNHIVDQYGGGVFVGNGNQFNMYGGKIQNNSAVDGGGVYIAPKDNAYQAGTMTIRGDAVIQNNKAGDSTNNVSLPSGSTIKIDGQMDASAQIGVTTRAGLSAGTVTIATATGADWVAAKNFTSDKSAYHVGLAKDGMTVQLQVHSHQWKYSVSPDGTTITAKCTAGNCDLADSNGGSVKIVAPSGSLIYDGNEHTATVNKSQDWQGEAVDTSTIVYTKEGDDTFIGKPKDAGTYTASITVGEGENAATASVKYTIAQAELTIDSVTVASKTYNGSADAEITNVTFTGLKNSEALTKDTDYEVSGTFNSANVNEANKVTGTVTLKDTSKVKNYKLPITTYDVSATIAQAATPAAPTGLTGVKDQLLSTVSLAAHPGWSWADGAVSMSTAGPQNFNANYHDSNGNYADGTNVPVSVNVVNKTDTGVTITGLPQTVTYGQEFTLTASQTGDTTGANKKWTWDYDQEYFKRVGPNANTETITLQAIKASTPSKDITATYESGTHKGSATVNAVVEKKEVIVSGITASSKPYDGTPNATVNASGAIITGKETGDNLTVSVSAGSTFDSADVGSRTVTLGALTLGGASAGNYKLAASGNQTTATANITVRDLTVKPDSGQRKTFGDADPALTYAYSGEVSGETPVFDGALSREAGEDVGQYHITKGSLEPKDSGTFKAANYNLVLDTVVVTFEITKGTYGGSAPTKTVNILKNYAGVQTGTLTAADFFTTAPAEAKITNAVPNADFSNMMSIAGADTSSGNFTYDSKTNITAASDESWTVTISSKNYTDITATLTFKLVDKADVSAQITFPNGTLTYNGAGQKYEKATISGVSGGTWTYTYTAATGTTASLDSTGLPLTAGTYTVTAVYEDDNNYGTANATLTINKATPTGTPTYTAITTSGKTLTDAALGIGSITPAGGTITWDAGNATVVAANTAYGWTYTPTDAANYNKLTGSITPYVVSSSGGGGGGSSAATPSVSDKVAKELKNAKEGSTVAIDMKGETKLPASVTKEIAGKDVTVELDMGGGTVWSFNGLDVPKGGVRLDLGVKTGTKTIPAKVINALTGEATTIQLQLDHNGPFGMSLKLSVDLGKKHDGLYANLYFYNPKSGELEFQSASMISGGKASWAFDHASDCAIVIDKESHEPMTFIDVPDSAYYAEAVNWAVAKKITGGVGNGLFAPNDPCTRAQIVTFLWRAAGSPVVNYAMNMTDVAEDAYYGEAVRWALSEGITTGTGDGKFSPDATCNRAQSVTFLFRAIGKIVDSKAEFGDVLTDSYYANAVAWAVENGITNGIGDGLFGPDNSCTRAQIVTFLFRAYQGK